MIAIEMPALLNDFMAESAKLLSTAGVAAGVTALGLWLRDRMHKPIDITTAVSQGGADLVDASNEFVKNLLARIESLEAWREQAEKDKKERDVRISLLETVIAMWSAFWMDLEARWDYHRLQDAPPPCPLTPDIKKCENE